MKIVKDEGGREGLHSKVNGITYNSFVVTLDSGGSGKLKVWEVKITTKSVLEGFGTTCINVSTGGVGSNFGVSEKRADMGDRYTPMWDFKGRKRLGSEVRKG